MPPPLTGVPCVGFGPRRRTRGARTTTGTSSSAGCWPPACCRPSSSSSTSRGAAKRFILHRLSLRFHRLLQHAFAPPFLAFPPPTACFSTACPCVSTADSMPGVSPPSGTPGSSLPGSTPARQSTTVNTRNLLYKCQRFPMCFSCFKRTRRRSWVLSAAAAETGVGLPEERKTLQVRWNSTCISKCALALGVAQAPALAPSIAPAIVPRPRHHPCLCTHLAFAAVLVLVLAPFLVPALCFLLSSSLNLSSSLLSSLFRSRPLFLAPALALLTYSCFAVGCHRRRSATQLSAAGRTRRTCDAACP